MTHLFEATEDAKTLRDYQQRAIEAIEESWKEHQATLMVAATGTGKTVTAAHLIRHHLKRGGRVLALAHQREIVDQMRHAIAATAGLSVQVEMAGMYARPTAQAVVGTVQTQIAQRDNGKRMQRFDPKDFTLLWIDEAHRAPADTYKQIINYYCRNKQLRVLGTTATPDRADEKALGQIFEDVPAGAVYEISDAIGDGWLVPIIQHSVHVQDLDFSNVKVTAGDLNGKELADLMEREKVLHGVAQATMKESDGQQVLLFSPSLDHAEQTCEIINRYEPDAARWVSGKTPDIERHRVFQDFRDGKYRVLCNVGVVTEGVDLPAVGCISIARKTLSRSLYCQMVGRGLRPRTGVVDGLSDPVARKSAIAGSGKPHCKVLDFAGVAGKHTLMSPVDILGGEEDDEVMAEARQISRGKQQSDPSDAIEKAREKVEKRRQQQEKKRKKLKANVKYSTKQVDPFRALDIEAQQLRGWDFSKKATEKQVKRINRMTRGKVDATDTSRKHASQILTDLFYRSRHGLATFGQANLLSRYGIDTEIPKDKASKIITAIRSNRWKPLPKGRVDSILKEGELWTSNSS